MLIILHFERKSEKKDMLKGKYEAHVFALLMV